MKTKLLFLILLCFNYFNVYSQDEIPVEFSLKFNFIEIYNPITKEITGEYYDCEWIFNKKGANEFEFKLFDEYITLSQMTDPEIVKKTDSEKEFMRIILEDKDGIPYLMDYHNDNDIDAEIRLFKNFDINRKFEMSYHFYIKQK